MDQCTNYHTTETLHRQQQKIDVLILTHDHNWKQQTEVMGKEKTPGEKKKKKRERKEERRKSTNGYSEDIIFEEMCGKKH